MPVSQFFIHEIILVLLDGFLETGPASANGLGVVADTALASKAISNLFLRTSICLHGDNNLIIGVHVPRNLLSGRSMATADLESLRIVLVTHSEGEILSFVQGGSSRSLYILIRTWTNEFEEWRGSIPWEAGFPHRSYHRSRNHPPRFSLHPS